MHVIAFDFEAGGGVPFENGFTQLGAVLFNMNTGKVEDSFNMYASMRGFDWEDRCVKEFWEKFPERYKETMEKCVESRHSPEGVVDAFNDWCKNHFAKLKNDVYLITDCATFDSGILKAFSNDDTLYYPGFPRDIVDTGVAYLGMCRLPFSTELVDGSAFKTCVKVLGITKPFTPSVFHDHHPVNDATVIAEKWFYVNSFLRWGNENPDNDGAV
jgi:hypothetical protein